MSGSWAARARPIIAEVLAETAGAEERTIRRALRLAYPFGERRSWPYKAWLAEIKRQRGLKPAAGRRKRNPVPAGQLALAELDE